jgi:hypothetical protein
MSVEAKNGWVFETTTSTTRFKVFKPDELPESESEPGSGPRPSLPWWHRPLESFEIDIQNWELSTENHHHKRESMVWRILHEQEKRILGAKDASTSFPKARGRENCVAAWRAILGDERWVYSNNKVFQLLDGLLTISPTEVLGEGKTLREYPAVLPRGKFVLRPGFGTRHETHSWLLDSRLTSKESEFPFDYVEVTIPVMVTWKILGKDADGHYVGADEPTVTSVDCIDPPSVRIRASCELYRYTFSEWMKSRGVAAPDCIGQLDVLGARECYLVWSLLCETGDFVDPDSRSIARSISELLQNRIV